VSCQFQAPAALPPRKEAAVPIGYDATAKVMHTKIYYDDNQPANAGYDLKIWTVAVNIRTLNKQSRKADKGWSSDWVSGWGITTFHCKETAC
jgi:hypothetical protein